MVIDSSALIAVYMVEPEAREEMIHVFQWFGPMLQEGRDAIDGLGRWIGQRLAQES